ncbi:hypothetical protein KAZ93_01500 [Patescibacteria group bacterium]|nr:hypothetical protein [Patescibacteria group bacterium]
MSHTLSRYSRLSKCTPIFLIGGLLLVQIIWSPLPSSLSSSDVYAGGGGFNCATATNINVPVQECYQIQAFYSANG